VVILLLLAARRGLRTAFRIDPAQGSFHSVYASLSSPEPCPPSAMANRPRLESADARQTFILVAGPITLAVEHNLGPRRVQRYDRYWLRGVCGAPVPGALRSVGSAWRRGPAVSVCRAVTVTKMGRRAHSRSMASARVAAS